MSSTTARSSSGSSPTAALFQVKEIAYDPWNATHIALRLQDEGAAMVEFRQGFRSMAAPTRELEKLIVSRKLAHGGNPVTRWMAANVAVAQDPAGNLKPAKDKSTERIDGIVAIIMAIGRAMVAPGGAAARVLDVLCLTRCDSPTWPSRGPYRQPQAGFPACAALQPHRRAAESRRARGVGASPARRCPAGLPERLARPGDLEARS